MRICGPGGTLLWSWPPGLVSPVAAEHVLSARARSDQLVGRLLDPDQPLATYPALKERVRGVFYFPNTEKCISLSRGRSGFLKKTR